MPVSTQAETLGFQAEIKQLLELMAHALYSNREIFLRELISNASDAADKLRFAVLSDDTLYEKDAELSIRVEYNKAQRTITVLDNGIGMSRAEVIENLGTIARSGTKQFFASLTGETSRDSQLIGQFGVGFYSAFVVAHKVEVISRRAGLAREEGVRWISTGESEFTIETVSRPRRGTKVILHLRDDMDEFLDGGRLRAIIRKYSDHISLPIVMPGEDEKDPGEETINNAQALWKRNKREVKDEEYQEFYKHIAHDFENPLAWHHQRVEGRLEYASLLFIPSRAPFDLWDRDQQHGIKLYVRRIFIMDDAEHLLPTWLRFIKGVVDCDDLPLNISREILQHSKTISAIRAGCTLKILGLLADLAKNEPERYEQFWKQFGRVLKEGVINAGEHLDALLALFRFATTHGEGEQQNVSLADYISRMSDKQNAIYYINTENYATAINSPHLEIFRKKGLEVLLLTDPIDEWLSVHCPEYEGRKLVSVNKGELSLAEMEGAVDDSQDKEDGGGEDESRLPAQHEAFLKRMHTSLDERVKEVRSTARLTDSPACLVVGEHELGRHMEQILKAAGQNVPDSKPVLEVNPIHPLVLRLMDETDDERFAEWCRIFFDQALLSEGGSLQDPSGYVGCLNRLLTALVGQPTTPADRGTSSLPRATTKKGDGADDGDHGGNGRVTQGAPD